MVTFTGLDSIIDRTLFTKHGPIVKKPLSLLTGSNLQIISRNEIKIPTGNFNSSAINKLIEISGSVDGRNDGSFYISEVINSTILKLRDVDFDITDTAATEIEIIALVNMIRTEYEEHRTQITVINNIIESVHGTDDIINVITAPIANDLTSAIVLINDIKTCFSDHIITISGAPPVHNEIDNENEIFSTNAVDLGSIIRLANEIRRKYENHRQNKFIHQHPDLTNIIVIPNLIPIIGTYPSPLTGPFTWLYKNPLLGKVANSSYDVDVVVNGSPAIVDTVFGSLGAVILQDKPTGSDTVSIDYRYICNPPSRYLKTNYPGYVTNQAQNQGYSGLSEHRYRAHSHIIDPRIVDLEIDPEFIADIKPHRIGWKYKGYERAYSAVTNDPTTLLTNVPTNRTAFPVLFKPVSEITIAYDPVTLPQNAIDPWIKHGDGVFSLASGGNTLTIIDENGQTGTNSKPPFFSHEISIESDNIINAAFRARVTDNNILKLDGVFTGVVFGISDGLKTILIGFLVTNANNLSSAIVLINDLKIKYKNHLVNARSHNPIDQINSTDIVDATDLTSLVILTNEIKSKYNNHITLGNGVGNIHQMSDSVNSIILPDATNLTSAIVLVNELRTKFNLHREESGVHFENDILNEVQQIKQIGILTNDNYLENVESWETYAVNWTEFISYRIFRDTDGNAQLYLSGAIEPIISVNVADLQSLSNLDASFNQVQQTFFGSIGRETINTSQWQFIRVNMVPISAILSEDNKSVNYTAVILPELDLTYPWVTIGQGGNNRIAFGSQLNVDSVASASDSDIQELGQASGAYTGYIRFEPILSNDTTVSVEFQNEIDYYTFGVDNRACGIYLEDGNLSVQLAFLQFDPIPAIITGVISEPFSIISGDSLIFRIGDAPQQEVIFTSFLNTSTGVALFINTILGFNFASVTEGKVRLTSVEVGSNASISLIGGRALLKLGFSIGIYSGADSNPEPRISWFGANFPNQDNPSWFVSGYQSSSMFGRTMRIIDDSINDYLAYTQNNLLIIKNVLNSTSDWKLDFNLNILSFITGSTIPATGPYLALDFAGALLSIDEGSGGKNIEIQFAVDISGNPFLNLLSYNIATANLDIISQYAFNWNDGQSHSFNIYTSKHADAILVYADSIALAPYVGPIPTYSNLNPGFMGPAISFGSGSEPVAGIDLRTAQSVVDWKSINIFKDSKINNLDAANNRYVGIYKGGSPSLLSSYYLHQIDWSIPHVYRLVRDPITSVDLFIDGSSIPSISTPYDILSLPPFNSTFFKQISSDNSIIGFGAFNSQEISRTRWSFIRYSIGKLTLTDRLIPTHHLINQANVIASPDHIYTKKFHNHYGFKIYSGGTPSDDFMADEEVISFTELGENIPPIPMTQNLESRGGLVKTATSVGSIPSVDLVNTNGFISHLENDIYNSITSLSALEILIQLVNNTKVQYEAHRSTESPFHFITDTVNAITAPNAFDLTSAIVLLVDLRAKINAHRIEFGVHIANDLINVITASTPIDFESSSILAEDIRIQYEAHRILGTSHFPNIDEINVITALASTPLYYSIILINELREKYLKHVIHRNVHLANDVVNVILPSIAIDQISAENLANAFKEEFNDHRIEVMDTQQVHIIYDIVNIITADDAVDVSTLALLLDNAKINYNAHLIELGIHGASVFIRIDPPSRVLYEGMKFWELSNEGEMDLVSSFTDDSCLANDIKQFYINYYGLYYDGEVLPEDTDEQAVWMLANDLKTQINAHYSEAGVHSIDDIWNQITSVDATDLTSAIILLNEIQIDFNNHLIQIGVHSIDDTENTSIYPQTIDLGTALALVNELKFRYENHRVNNIYHLISDIINVIIVENAPPVADLGWQLLADNPSFVSTNITSGVFRYGTTGLTKTAYIKETGLPSHPSLDFEITTRMRLNSFACSTNIDTGIYFGFVSPIGPGISAGLGFDIVSNISYVKIQDVHSNTPLYRIPFEWYDGQFHTYKLIKNTLTNSLELIIIN